MAATVIRPQAAAAPRQSPFVPGVTPPEPSALVISGATADLAARTLLPARYGRWHGGVLPEQFAIVGVGRRDKNDDGFREEVRAAVTRFRPADAAAADRWDSFLGSVFYDRADFTTSEGMRGLAQRLQRLDAERKLPGNHLF